MPDFPESLAAQLALAGTLVAALALISGVLDHRHSRRADLDRVGLMPWGRMSVLLLFLAIVLLSLALRAR